MGVLLDVRSNGQRRLMWLLKRLLTIDLALTLVLHHILLLEI
jgi:hypothetical protein